MRIIPLIFFVFIPVLSAHAQGTLEKIFYNLPAEYTMSFDLETKKDEIREMKENTKNGDFEGSFIDERNGYLRRVGYQCVYELCYWKEKQEDSVIINRRVVAIISGCMSVPIFFIEENGIFAPTSFEAIEIFDASYFFKNDISKRQMKPYLSNFRFSLPWKGRTIIAHYGSPYGGKEGAELLKGDKIDFIWKDGTFEIGEPYF